MMEKAIEYLKEHGIVAFELGGVLMIPASSPEELYSMIPSVGKLLAECGYNKSWCVDPYYYERHESLTSAMFEQS